MRLISLYGNHCSIYQNRFLGQLNFIRYISRCDKNSIMLIVVYLFTYTSKIRSKNLLIKRNDDIIFQHETRKVHT